MFTGIIESVGRVCAVHKSDGGMQVAIAAADINAQSLCLGDSIAVDGVCLTATELNADSIGVFVSNETIACSRFGIMQAGMMVNIEHPLTVAKGLGGHIVTGHVDGLARCVEVRPDGDSTYLAFEVTAMQNLGGFIAAKGSIAIDGVSMTVNQIQDVSSGTQFAVNMVPFTRNSTTLGRLLAGDDVHIEVDIMARYAQRALTILNT